MEELIVKGVDFTEFQGLCYKASRHPGNTSVDKFLSELYLGANCQLFTLGVLRKAGFYIDDKLFIDQGERFGSRELWLDAQYTELVASGKISPQALWALFLEGEMRVFDIYFFLPPSIDFRDDNSFIDDELLKKFHIAIFTGFDLRRRIPGRDSQKAFLHNAKPGPSALWSLSDFTKAGYSLVGIKRPIQRLI